MSGIFSVALRIKHLIAAPATPPAGQSLLYFKNDSLPYCKTPAGNEHPLVENVVVAPPDESPTLSAVGSNVAITLVSDGLVAPSTILDYYMDDVLIASTRSMVFVVTQETDGDPLSADVMYDFRVVARNQFGAGPSSATVTTTLNLAIDTETILSTVAAGFVLAGEIKVGNISIHPDTGIVIPLSSGGEIRFPADGSPAIIDAILRTSDLTVSGGLSINGVSNYINGKVFLASGVGNPQTVLDMNWVQSREVRRFPTVTSPEKATSGLARTTSGPVKWGTILTQSSGGEKVFSIIDDTTGAQTASVHSDTAVLDFRSVIAIGAYFYVLGHRWNSTKQVNEFRVHAYDATGAFQAGVYPLNINGDRIQPLSYWDGAIGADPNGTHYWIARTQANGKFRWTRYQTAGMVNVASGDILSSNSNNSVVRAMYIGNGDLGGSRVVFGGWGDDSLGVRVFLADGTYQSSQGWSSASYPNGLIYDTTTSRWLQPRHDDTSVYIAEYSPETTDQTIYGQYSWYDNNASGGNKESAPSPINSRLIPKRAFPYLSVPAPPKSGVGEDDPNAVKVFTDTDTGTKLLTTITTGAATTYISPTLIGTGAAPLVTSTFTSASATGEVASASGVDYFRGTGAFHFGGISGTGDGVTVADPLKVTGFQPIGTVVMYAGAAAPAGWLLCSGQTLNAVTNPEYQPLFNVIGTTFGGTSNSAFIVPDMRRRFPWGADAAGGTLALGSNEGQTTVASRTTLHSHGIPNQDLGRVLNTTAGGSQPRLEGPGVHDHGGNTNNSLNPNNSMPNLGLNFIIRYI